MTKLSNFTPNEDAGELCEVKSVKTHPVLCWWQLVTLLLMHNGHELVYAK
jgi:hypothetical protein